MCDLEEGEAAATPLTTDEDVRRELLREKDKTEELQIKLNVSQNSTSDAAQAMRDELKLLQARKHELEGREVLETSRSLEQVIEHALLGLTWA